jgi:hypothetical protein
MSDQETAATPAKKTGKPAVVWTIRIVVFGVLAALLVVAGLDFRAKKQMGETLARIGDKLETPDSDLTLQQAEELLVGSPDIADAKGTRTTKKKIYTWNGFFRKHELAIIYHDYGKTTIVKKVTPDVDETE